MELAGFVNTAFPSLPLLRKAQHCFSRHAISLQQMSNALVRNTLQEPDENRYPHTYNGYDAGECASAFQKCVRRGMPEAIGWGLELYWTSMKMRTHIWNRVIVVAVEDISLANPMLICNVAGLRKLDTISEWGLGNYEILARTIELLTVSQKSRLNDWMLLGITRFTPEELQIINSTDLEVVVDIFHRCIINAVVAQKGSDSRREYISYVYKYALYLWHDGRKVKFKETALRKCAYYVWKVIGKFCKNNPILNQVYEVCFELSQEKNWAWQDKSILLWTHCLNCVIFCEELANIFPRVLITNVILTDEQRTTLIGDRYNRQNLIGIPDFAVDMHTARGKNMLRGFEHFMQVGSLIVNQAPELIELENYYRNLCI